MSKFIATYPEVLSWLVGLLVAIIGGLLSALLLLVKMAVDRLTFALHDLKISLEADRADIGGLKDRMVAQETICAMQRGDCRLPPLATIIKP